MKVKKLRSVEVYELNQTYQQVMNWFFAFPQKEFSLTEISQELGIAKTTTKRAVTKLVNEGFLRIEIIGRVWRISCNSNHPYNLTRKIGHNLGMIYESGILQELRKITPNPKAVILFGSYRWGSDNEKSDIDIAIEILGNDEMKILQLGVLPRFGFRANTPVNLHIFCRNKIDPNLFANIANGILLEGLLEVRP
jgi:predicted nucleotidyltransferase